MAAIQDPRVEIGSQKSTVAGHTHHFTAIFHFGVHVVHKCNRQDGKRVVTSLSQEVMPKLVDMIIVDLSQWMGAVDKLRLIGKYWLGYLV